MLIKTTPYFRKRLAKCKKNHRGFSKKFVESIELYQINPKLVNDHSLKRELSGLRSFSVDYDLRIVYKKVKGGILLLNIGSHSEVY